MTRLSYRPIAHDDLDLFAEFLADGEATRYLIVPRPHTRAEASALLDRWVAQHEGELGMYTASLGAETIGWVGLSPDLPVPPTFFFGCSTLSENQ